MILDRSTAYSILAPDHATPREAFAAEELSRYLTMILGAAPVAAERADVRLIVGGPGRNPAALSLIKKDAFDALVTGKEGYLVRITENAVLLAGSEVGGHVLSRSLYVLNPGSLGAPRGGAPSYGRVDLCAGGIVCSHGNL